MSKKLSVQAQTTIEELPALLSQGNETPNGPGSFIEATEDVRNHLPKIFKKYKIKSITDAPCGDFHWMKEVNLTKIKYHGYDLMPEYIEDNKEEFKTKNITFYERDIVERRVIRKADLIICRDFLMHIKFDKIKKVIKNFKKSKSKYLLATNFSNYSEHGDSFCCSSLAAPPNPPEDWDGEPECGWRPLNLLLEPFNFPEPIYEFVEEHPNCGGRSMCMWKLDSIKVS